MKSLSAYLKQPAVSLGELLFFLFVVFAFWGTAFTFVFIESISPACAANQLTDDERMYRDFGLIPDPPVDLSPVRIEYGGAPVPVVLAVGTERRLVFDQPFRIGFEPSVAGYFTLEIYDRHLLVRALRPVATRARVQLASGTIVPLDVQAISGAGPAGPLEIAVAPRAPAEPDPEPKVVPPDVLPTAVETPGYVDLVRYAAQRFYAPQRLHADRPGLRGVPVAREPIRLIRGVLVETTPLAGWEEGGLVVTAIRADNTGQARVRLDPRQVVGFWRAAAFQHSILRPGEATILYLVSDVPFEEALGIYGTQPSVARSDAPSTQPSNSGAGYGAGR